MPKVKYFKRHRMELPLPHLSPPPELPTGFRWVPWDDSLLPMHAEVKFQSFHQHEDALVFPSLGTRTGCRELMSAIRYRDTFCPQATWLVVGPAWSSREAGLWPRQAASSECYVGTIQGLLDSNGFGGIQNLGVVPECRGLGLGRALLLKALAGFASVGVPRAFLEVTATNAAAVRLYRAAGFRAYKTLYRAVELPEPDAVPVGI